MRVTTLFFDMNSYFASVAQQEEPALIGQPVGVLTKDSKYATCIAASIEAKRFGIKMGTKQEEARRLCPDVVFRPVKHDVCVDYHHRIRAAVETVIPIKTAYSVDEFACDLSGSQQNLDVALELAHRLQRTVLARVGRAMHCSVGLGPNVLLAKIAAELKKPGGVNWLLPEIMPQRIAHLALDDLPGISRRMRARLERADVRDVVDLYALPPRQARAIWHSVVGERFVRELRGETIVHPEPRQSMIGHGQVLSGANKTPEGARLVVRRLLVKAAARLRREGLMARHLSVGLTCARHGRQGRDGTFPATQDTFILLKMLGDFWQSLPCQLPETVHVTLSGLIPPRDYIPDLFDQPQGTSKNRVALWGLIDQLNYRFGQDTVRIGELPRHRVAYTGAKIAFRRIPEAEDFLE